jgi:hypothetical protein
MGTVLDLRRREAHVRMDDEALRFKLSQARSAIYNSGYVVNSAYIEMMLKEHSLVPAAVCVVPCFIHVF